MIPDKNNMDRIVKAFFDIMPNTRVAEIPLHISEKTGISLEDTTHGVGLIRLYIDESISRCRKAVFEKEKTESQVKADIIAEANEFSPESIERIYNYASWCVSKG